MDHTLSFPKVSGTSLAGESFDFPGSFGADLSLVLVAFWDWQQPAVDSWIEPAALLEIQAPGFEYFEMPTIQATTPDVHRFIDEGMRAGIPDRFAREKIVTLYLDKAAFLRHVGLPTDDDIYALLVDRNGLILRIWSGTATERSRSQLIDFVHIADAVA